jgi:23S rRNA (guanine2445-N2)-methyltransferase / 23S rRNA (guanine2069-N7)-methyltransferase
MSAPVDRSLDMFANRLRKDARHLGKWAKRTGVTCWRIYDRDIPEVPVTVETYGGALVVHDVRIDASDGAWLDAIAEAARVTLDASELFVKRRQRIADRQGGHQYERLGEQGAWRVVHEGGHAFRVNLSDYLDAGLFLDHRTTRAQVAHEQAATCLNLYAYTGAFTVYAAAAGMRTTSVDLSNTYLEWARENLELNRLTGELVHEDVREFLAAARTRNRRWDVAIVDPPTFSSSKRMSYTWDVQRDHAALLADVWAVTDRVVWFSTNKRKFRLAYDAPDLAITDETVATTPPDFRHRPHRAWRMARRVDRAARAAPA